MSDVGKVLDVHIPTDRETGRPRGFAFVKFGSAEEAQAAIERFDGEELGGRPLRVSAAQERRDRPGRSGPGGRPSRDSAPGLDEGEDDVVRFDESDDRDWRSERARPRGKGSRKGARGKKRSL